jgi:RNA polymerase sigma-70 factor (sigma-E family)
MVMSSYRASTSGLLDGGFEHFVRQASPGLLRSAYVLVGNHSDAEDVLQVVMLRTLGRWEAIEGAPAAYAFAVLVNLSRDRRRARRRRPVTISQNCTREPATVDEIDRVLERDAVVRVARRLPRRQREILACRFLLDLSVPETAMALGVPEGTVKSYTARALDRMRALLEADQVAVPKPEQEVADAE